MAKFVYWLSYFLSSENLSVEPITSTQLFISLINEPTSVDNLDLLHYPQPKSRIILVR